MIRMRMSKKGHYCDSQGACFRSKRSDIFRPNLIQRQLTSTCLRSTKSSWFWIEHSGLTDFVVQNRILALRSSMSLGTDWSSA